MNSKLVTPITKRKDKERESVGVELTSTTTEQNSISSKNTKKEEPPAKVDNGNRVESMNSETAKMSTIQKRKLRSRMNY